MSWNTGIVEEYKNKFCVISFIVGCVGLFLEFSNGASLTIKTVLGLFCIFLPVFWNYRLYDNMFETEKSRQIISYSTFMLIGLVMVLGVFSGFMAGLIEDLFALKKTLKVRWVLMALLFLGVLLFVRSKNNHRESKKGK